MSPYICPESPPTTSCGDYSSTDENAYDGSRNSDVNHDPSGVNQIEPIAVIGLSLEFPQEATSTEAFWQMLIEARSGRTGIPKDRFNLEAFHHPDAGRQDNVSYGFQFSRILTHVPACSSTLGRVISSRRTLAHLMHRSSPSLLRKRQVWIHSSEVFLRLPTELLRMVRFLAQSLCNFGSHSFVSRYKIRGRCWLKNLRPRREFRP